MTTEIRGDLAGSMSMSLRRGAHRSIVGTRSLSFLEDAVKSILDANGDGRSSPRHGRQCTIGRRKEFIGLAGRERSGRRFAPVGPHAVNENLAPPGSAHIIVAHSMDKQLPPWALRRFGCDAGSC